MAQDFTTALSYITARKTDRGLALVDLVREVHACVAEIELPVRVRVYLTCGLASVEEALARGCTESLQTAGLVGVFKRGLELAN